jgi:hypothetical protein
MSFISPPSGAGRQPKHDAVSKECEAYGFEGCSNKIGIGRPRPWLARFEGHDCLLAHACAPGQLHGAPAEQLAGGFDLSRRDGDFPWFLKATPRNK